VRVMGEVPLLSLGIGTLGEKSLHRILKLYLEPNEELHEIPFLSSVADIKREDGIYEIQTHSTEKLLPKIDKFLREERVCVVLPVISKKIIRYFDSKTGEISDPKVSPKRENIFSAIGEIYKIRKFLCAEKFSVKLLFVEAEEYKMLAAARGKRKIDLIPTSLVSEIDLKNASDYLEFIKEFPQNSFSAKELAKVNKCPKRFSSALAGVLHSLGIIQRVGKEKNAYVYKRTEL